jgi:hypothetical protein
MASRPSVSFRHCSTCGDELQRVRGCFGADAECLFCGRTATVVQQNLVGVYVCVRGERTVLPPKKKRLKVPAGRMFGADEYEEYQPDPVKVPGCANAMAPDRACVCFDCYNGGLHLRTTGSSADAAAATQGSAALRYAHAREVGRVIAGATSCYCNHKQGEPHVLRCAEVPGSADHLDHDHEGDGDDKHDKEEPQCDGTFLWFSRGRAECSLCTKGLTVAPECETVTIRGECGHPVKAILLGTVNVPRRRSRSPPAAPRVKQEPNSSMQR